MRARLLIGCGIALCLGVAVMLTPIGQRYLAAGVTRATATASAVTVSALLREGDLIFQASRSAQSSAIQHATGSPWSHMGMIVVRAGKPHVLEAAKTVRYTPLADWIARGQGGHFTVKRLRDADQILTPSAIVLIEREAQIFLDRAYDTAFAWSDERIYCSELVWKIYHCALGIDIGQLQRIRDFNLTDPVVAAVIRQRYGNTIPLDEPVIAPVAMYNSPLLITVMER
jgi:hypothetical protein